MEHARKMVLIPKESVDRLQALSVHGKLNSVQTPGTTTSRLDAEMNDILNSVDNMTEREKWQRYSQVLQRYLHFKDVLDNSKKSRNDDVEEGEEENADNSIDQGAPSTSVDARIVESVPSKFQNKARNLLQHLRICGNVTWNKQGTTFVDGTVVRKANIIDLLNDAMRERKNHPPPAGHLQFAAALQQAGVPREFIGNSRILHHLNASLTTSSPLWGTSKVDKSGLNNRSLNNISAGEFVDASSSSSKRFNEDDPISETPTQNKKKKKKTVSKAITPGTVKKWKQMSKEFRQ